MGICNILARALPFLPSLDGAVVVLGWGRLGKPEALLLEESFLIWSGR